MQCGLPCSHCTTAAVSMLDGSPRPMTSGTNRGVLSAAASSPPPPPCSYWWFTPSGSLQRFKVAFAVDGPLQDPMLGKAVTTITNKPEGK